MKKVGILLSVLWFGIIFSQNVFAEEKVSREGKYGPLLGYFASSSTSLGLNYFLNHHFAIRPSIFTVINKNKNEDYSYYSGKYESNEKNMGFSLSVNYYFDAYKNLSVYLGPGCSVQYNEKKTKDEDYVNPLHNTSSRVQTLKYGGNISLGFEYLFTEQFGVYYESSIKYTYSRSSSGYYDYAGYSTGCESNRSHSFTTLQSAIGIVFYIN